MIDDRTWEAARRIHEAKIAFCWGKQNVGEREPWPQRRPGDFGYEPQPWVDVAVAQAKAALATDLIPVRNAPPPPGAEAPVIITGTGRTDRPPES